MHWHDEFRAYARAFGKDEVAAILLRNSDGEEWLVWPKQVVEGLTFTLNADAILDSVPVDQMGHVVGWVHSHPMGLDPDPSSVDDDQIREFAIDAGGSIVEMVIFGGPDYRDISVTRALVADDEVFVSDTTIVSSRPKTQWDDAAREFYEASRRPAVDASPIATHRAMSSAWSMAQWDDDVSGDQSLGHFCPMCCRHESDTPGMLCWDCEYNELRSEVV